MLERLNQCISNSPVTYRCDYYDESVVGNILGAFDGTEIWLKVFIGVLGRVKDNKGTPIGGGLKRVSLPIGRKKCMTVFYKENTGKQRYLIYDFKVTDR
jgi:hypothetical protein